MPSSELRSFDSWKPGFTITLMAWVHGNERSWILLLEELADTIQIVQWKIHLILRANPRAIDQNIRQTEKNMNRSFHDIPTGTTYEDHRAQELIPMLRQSDILLDIHNTLNTQNSVPFLISEHTKWDPYFPVDVVVSGLDTLHPGGSDGYMNSIGKVWLCIESGSIYDPRGPEIARESVLNFLRATGSIEGLAIPRQPQSKYHLDTIIHSHTSEFQFTKEWKDFEMVSQGEIVAYDGWVPVCAPYDGVIVFPYASTNPWDEVCVFGLSV